VKEYASVNLRRSTGGRGDGFSHANQAAGCRVRSAELAAGFAGKEWKDAPNGLSAEANYQLQTSLGYAGLASMVLRELGI
jgi:hypothetical protein